MCFVPDRCGRLMREPIILAEPGRTTSRLTVALLVALAVVAVAFVSQSYAYWRVTRQLDKVRAEAEQSSVVLTRIEELAGLFAESARPDADRAAIAERLAELAEEIRVSRQRNERPTTTTTSQPSTTTSSTTSTTSPNRCSVEVRIAGVCLR